ncbi:MAG: cell surface protein [Flavobacteriia bacterium]|nr:cell surface protein [Flavobacteriia bacterium]PIV95397.1 MAG: cell surface protein [Flavobacteriaceae bacterium CG17_big_fil_post_rev_8_21_14_2_50_31_13]PIX12871.1 MAG: cell surface protein [Flavobacteriaceae bacterium CG_4_8_14_3_um_filter_31_8]PIY13761.1 MAG: cell surface protein [Flavobacteriaceae bacterium CG_4_10_14_3_um_filter_31_253]PIZ12369.1 MAG: cell surface protein [Flavobacteriaceae bacterium CG_4_10_14_0_8_um_filter_31_99]PJC11320.1 MAG: cell surface protein [Flavobacteriaceae
MKTTSYIIVLFLIVVSCSKNAQQQITNPKDYTNYLKVTKNGSLANAQKEVAFWSAKLLATPNQYPYLQKIAAANTQLFSITGNIEYLKEAETNLLQANKKTNYDNASYLRSLARNYVSQHRFKEALEILLKAEKNGENLQSTEFQLIDVYLELGNIKKAEEYLSNVKNFESFEYLIRISKFSDALGNLDSAISYLEKALKKIENSNKPELLEWTHTNLGDYYGHAGRLQDSYQSYLKALEINSNNSYAKKGIAWIVFSHEKNPAKSLEILAAIEQETMAPDLHLLKAEIAEYSGNFAEKEQHIKQYFIAVNNEKYGAMYAKYNVLLLAENKSTIKEAIEIAKREVKERPTAQSYDLLAWSYFKNGDVKKALSIIEKQVIPNTFEPELLFHAVQILKASKRNKEANLLLADLKESSFELGPNIAQMITKL